MAAVLNERIRELYRSRDSLMASVRKSYASIAKLIYDVKLSLDARGTSPEFFEGSHDAFNHAVEIFEKFRLDSATYHHARRALFDAQMLLQTSPFPNTVAVTADILTDQYETDKAILKEGIATIEKAFLLAFFSYSNTSFKCVIEHEIYDEKEQGTLRS